MTDDGSTQSTAVWPLPKFYFSVQFGDGDPVGFQEVGGLEAETHPVEYRHGNSPSFYPIKMPGLGRVGNITLKKGMVPADHAVWSWFASIRLDSVARQTVIVRLLDEKGAVTMLWTLANAWPVKLTSSDLASDGNEIVVESMEIAFETMTVAAS